MTFPAFSLSPRSFRKAAFALLAAVALHSCAHPEDAETRRRRPDHNSSRFEWAVQHYEAGNYEKAIASFESLRKDGAAIPDFDLIPFYLGMSQYRLKHFETAAGELESFVRAGGDRQESQDARVTLLLACEKLGRWKDAASLAMETDKATLFQYNRALLKLVWARALREQGEILGARTALDEAQPFLDKVGTDDGGQPYYADPDQDLWGRFHYTAILVQESECTKLMPRDLAGPAPEPEGKEGSSKKKKKRAPRLLYAPWLESVADCQRQAIVRAADDLFERESPWGAPSLAAIQQGLDAFATKIQIYLRGEVAALERHRALQKSARENLYRILEATEVKLKYFKDHELNSEPLESLRKHLDRLLVQGSSP